MKRPFSIMIIFLLFFSNEINAQKDSTLLEINQQIWTPFSLAFENLDFELFNSIHHKDFIRISGNQDVIKTREDYLNQYQENWKDGTRKIKISFRFVERIYSKDTASERGIYKLTVNPKTEEEVSYYGKFHVLMTKDNEKWQLIMDYDSNENNTIDETSYMKAKAIDELN